ncbi:HTH-type transcriptional regulator ArgP [Azohydromonas australica]|uniref:HTH-type transcriptional regulator ArgP n=1 Tax=Azohydromonas australica TaxID=364039 RepID=UPI000685EC3F|nr:HTH-type transcriptional regulator ArgP [Azohydromonas australica]
MLDRDQLTTFAAVVEQQSFEKAATALSITRGAVSQRIKALEEALSSVLLVREKPVVPTAQGEVLWRHVQALRLLESDTLAKIKPEPQLAPVPLAIAVNADSLATWIPTVLWPLMRQHRIALEVITDDQDHTLRRLARGEVIGCISTEARPATGFIAEPLGAMEYRCFATRSFADEHFAKGFTLQAALRAPAVLFNRKDSLHDEFLQNVFGMKVENYTKHYLPAPGTLLDGIASGVGYGLVPTVQVQGRYATELVDLAPRHPVCVSLHWHHWTVEPPLSQVITALVVAEAAKTLTPALVSQSCGDSTDTPA